jgi:hypothetical protein
MPRRSLSASVAAAAFLLPRPAAADEPRAEKPLIVVGEVSGTIAPVDHSAYFNHSDYGRNALREARISLAAEARLGRRVRLLGEVRTENLAAPRVYALYVRVRPWVDRPFDVQAGVIPPVFGSFPRQRYALDNPLIGLPLAYQYLTIIRTDAVPASADDLLRMRGAGWRVRYPVGSGEWEQGLPLVSARRWDTGVQARMGLRRVEVTAALTQGSLASPRVDDDNGGKQVSGRVAWRPQAGLVVGASASRGAYLADEVARLLPAGRSYRQLAWGTDLEYSRGYWLARAEAIWSGWDSPVWSTPLKAKAISVEGRYKVMAGGWLAGRVDRLGFSTVAGNVGWGSWDAPVWRVEAGGGYSLRRNLLLKAAWQYNWRDGGRVRRKGLAAAQVLYWF